MLIGKVCLRRINPRIHQVFDGVAMKPDRCYSKDCRQAAIVGDEVHAVHRDAWRLEHWAAVHVEVNFAFYKSVFSEIGDVGKVLFLFVFFGFLYAFSHVVSVTRIALRKFIQKLKLVCTIKFHGGAFWLADKGWSVLRATPLPEQEACHA